MKVFYTLLLLLIYTQSFAQEKLPQVQEKQIQDNLNLKFIENKNQWQDDIRFRALVPGGVLFIKNTSLHYTFFEAPQKRPHGEPIRKETLKGHGVAVEFLEANFANIKGENPSQEKWNYYKGNNPEKWASQVPSFHEVWYEELYKGIDLKFFQNKNSLKYEFKLAPNADPKQIRLHYKGAENISLHNGDLVIETSLGSITEKAPYSYQIIRDELIEVPSRFVLKNNTLTFEFPQGYDESHELIIDPELIFSTYSGASFDNWGFTATFDDDGRLYSGGILFDSDQSNESVTIGGFTFTPSGQNDTVLFRFSPDGSNLEYATLIGGDVVEFPHSIIVNNNNELVIFGTTGSSNFPITSDAHSSSFGGGSTVVVSGNTFTNGSDVYVAKLDPNGVLLASTYIGGSANDGFNISLRRNYGDESRGDVFVDENDFIYIATSTLSSDFPIEGTFSRPLSSNQEGVVLKINTELSDIVWSTALGGSNSDAAFSIKLNSANEIYISGATNSTNFPTIAADVFNPNSQGGLSDGFVSKLSNAGQLLRSTYLGTSAEDHAFLLDLDTGENVYIFGLTDGAYPVTTGAFSTTFGGQFLQKLDANLTTSLASTNIGSISNSPNISPTAFLVSDCNKIYITGWGGTTGGSLLSTVGLPTTSVGGEQTTTDGSDFYFSILDEDFSGFLYGSFFGENGGASGDHVDGGTARFDKNGTIYQTVCASCGGTNGFPTTGGVWSSNNNSSNCNIGAFKFNFSIQSGFNVEDSFGVEIEQGCEFPLDAVLASNASGATSWEWFLDDDASDGIENFVLLGSGNPTLDYEFPQVGLYEFMLVVTDGIACPDTARLTIPVSVIDIVENLNDMTLCEEDLTMGIPLTITTNFLNINASSPTLTWTPDDSSITLLSEVDDVYEFSIMPPVGTTTYTFVAEDENGCKDEQKMTITVIPDLPDSFDIAGSIAGGEACTPADVGFKYEGDEADFINWTITDPLGNVIFNGNGEEINLAGLLQAGTYTVRLEAERTTGVCPDREEIDYEFELYDIEVTLTGGGIFCEDETAALEASASASSNATGSVITYQWSPEDGLDDPTRQNPTLSPVLGIDTYVVKASLTLPSGLVCEDEASLNLQVFPIVEPDFTFELDTDCGKPTSITLTNNTLNADEFFWDMGNGDVLVGENPPPYTYPAGTLGDLEITLRASNQECEEVLVQSVFIEDNLTLPPNAITPNGDGKNETFMLSAERPGYKIQVHNRWGNEVFSSNDYQDNWGRNAEPGMYYYIITSPSGTTCKGFIKVMK